jgi:hypothetical protein
VYGLLACQLCRCVQLTAVLCVPPAGQAERFLAGSLITSLYMFRYISI